MLVIRNRFIPFEGFRAINLFGVLFCRKDAKITDITLNHEEIHTAQMKELLYIPFYILYLFYYVWNLIIYRSWKKAYFEICFEKEAYAYEGDFYYLERRKKYSCFHIC